MHSPSRRASGRALNDLQRQDECVFRPQRRSRSNRVPPGPRVQLNEFLDKQATAQRLSTHQYRLEGAILALSETEGAEGGCQLWTGDHRRPLVFVRLLSQGLLARAPA